MQKLIKNIEQWAEDRNLIKGSTPQKQFLKLMEEFGELCSGVSRNKPEVIKDSIGDCFVVMTIMNKQTVTNFDFKSLELNLNRFPDKLNVTMTKATARLASICEKLNRPKGARFHLEYDFGYLLFCLMQFAKIHELDFLDCIQYAWDEIKDRKGKMIDGVFVKEEDLP